MPTRSFTADEEKDAGAAFSPPAPRFALDTIVGFFFATPPPPPAGFFSSSTFFAGLLSFAFFASSFFFDASTTSRARSAASSRSLLGRESASTSTVMTSSTRRRLSERRPAMPPLLWFLPMYASAPRLVVLGGSGSTIAFTCSSVRPYLASFASRSARSASGLSFPPWLVMRPFLR